jgi:hypothetical protein
VVKKNLAPSLLTSFLHMKLRILLLFFFFVIGSTNLLAQSLSDIGKVKVDMLSDAQLQEMVQRAKDNGLNESQVVTMARERGMPAGEVGKLQQRLAKLKLGARGGQEATASEGSERTMEGESELSEVPAPPALETLSPYQQKIFGFTLFYNKELNLMVLDANLKNILRDFTGKLFPIDVVVGEPGSEIFERFGF